MACFILKHGPVGEFTQERLMDCGHKLMSSLPQDVKWLEGWYMPDEDTLLCHWDAPSGETVLRIIDEAGLTNLFPIKSIEEAVEVPPEWLAPKRPRGRPRKVRR